MRTFRLYPQEQHWWSYSDYGAVLDVMNARKPARVLEFGPGSSTLALIEGGATHIDCCEDDPAWAWIYNDRLARRFPKIVHILPYTVSDPIDVPGIDGERYDMALIDGPVQTARVNVIRYCLDRCDAVLLPTEDWEPAAKSRRAQHGRMLANACAQLAEERGLKLTITETGPLSGAFALLC